MESHPRPWWWSSARSLEILTNPFQASDRDMKGIHSMVWCHNTFWIPRLISGYNTSHTNQWLRALHTLMLPIVESHHLTGEHWGSKWQVMNLNVWNQKQHNISHWSFYAVWPWQGCCMKTSLSWDIPTSIPYCSVSTSVKPAFNFAYFLACI